MTKSNLISMWAAVIGLFITIIGSTSILGFKIGVMSEKVASIENTPENIPVMKNDIIEMRTDITEM